MSPSETATDRVPGPLDGIAWSFDAACELAGGASDDLFTIAGFTIRLRFASPVLRDSLTRAFAHLATPETPNSRPPALTVHLWDSATTGAPAPPTPDVPRTARPHKGTEFFADPDLTPIPGQLHANGPVYYSDGPAARLAYYPAIDVLNVFDPQNAQAWHWVRDADDQMYWQKASPIRQLLYWFLSGAGIIQLHASSIGIPGGGVLAAGKSGSGKSTVALSTLGGELLYAGDDYVAVSLTPTPSVHSLYSSGKLNPPHARARLPQLVPLIANADKLLSEKAVLYANEHFPAQMTAGYPLRAVLVPRVCDRVDTRIVETSRAAAFAALAPSTVLQLHPPNPDALRSISGLVERVPCFGLELGSDTNQIGPTILELLTTLPPGSS